MSKTQSSYEDGKKLWQTLADDSNKIVGTVRDLTISWEHNWFENDSDELCLTALLTFLARQQNM